MDTTVPRMRRYLVGLGVGVAAFAAMSASVAAHECFNPNKDARAPQAGVNYTITGFDESGPIFEQTGPGKGIGGFVALSPELTELPEPLYVYSLGGGNNPFGVVGGPGSAKEDHACDGKGVDYLPACFGD